MKKTKLRLKREAAVTIAQELYEADIATTITKASKAADVCPKTLRSAYESLGVECPWKIKGKTHEQQIEIVNKVIALKEEGSSINMAGAAKLYEITPQTLQRYFENCEVELPWVAARYSKRFKEAIIAVPATEFQSKSRDIMVAAVFAIGGFAKANLS